MPKAPPNHDSPHSGGHGPTKNNAPSLKRYQACHQCRKRKLKCDAKRPCCGTCVRSHAYAVAHAVDGVVLPDVPECTYDEVPVFDSESGSSVSRKLYEKMESKINELETLLREKDRAIEHLQTSSITHISPIVTPGSDTKQLYPADFSSGSSKYNRTSEGTPPSVNGENGLYPQFAGHSSSPGSSVNSAEFPQFTPNSTLDGLTGVSGLLNVDNFGLEIRSWPPNLPSPEITRHLVEAFFAFHIHAGRLFHMPTFMASLELLPTDLRFPSTAVLHAMCAVGSLYTAAVPSTQLYDPPHDSPYELFNGRWRKAHPRPDYFGVAEEQVPESFTEQQARFAKQVIDVGLVRADFQCLQAQIILTWWYLSQGRWTDAFLSAAHAIRCTAPCSLSTCYTTAAITHYKPPSVLAPAKSVIEDEMRRNTFWIAYAMERQQGTGNGWALSLDDMDVCQLLPLRGDQYDQGILVLPEERQWSYNPDLLYTHPDHQTDSFILYIKASILLSRVKTFNLRFRWRYYTGNNTMPSNEDCDAKSTAEFQQLDSIVANFRQAFPARFRSPVTGDILDPYLYTACTAAYLAQILLHEPHAKPNDISCMSGRKTLSASRSIVDLMYTLTATNFDVSLLDLQPFMCWFMAGRVLVRFLRASIDEGIREQILLLQSQVSFVRTMLAKAGERVPLAYRYGKMLHDTLTNMCGEQFAEPIPEYLPPRGHYITAMSQHTNGDLPHTVEHIVL